ncbi:MAG: hypothetical protein ACJATT_003169 [Myxococcota bacterium]|jgi:hypothetical protein
MRWFSIPLLAATLVTGCSEFNITDFEVVDTFVQDPTEEVDILIVIDNSGSMQGYQLLLGARFTEFISAFVDADVDYHIGVTTTTIEPVGTNEGCLQQDVDEIPLPGQLAQNRYITTQSEDAEDIFAELVNVGTCGSGDERGLEAARMALSPEIVAGPNYGFIRPDAALSLIFVSDEQDGSTLPVADYINDLYEVKGQRERGVVNASALVITDIDDCIVQPGGSSEGTRYVRVAEEMGGIIGNLCNVNFVEMVTQLSLNASRVQDTFYLSDWPDSPSMHVFVEDDELLCQDGAWTYQQLEVDGELAPAIVFDRAQMPRSKARLAVRYDRGAGDLESFCPPVEEQ